MVSFGDLQLFCAERDVIHYRLRGKIEIGSCVSFALVVHKQTHDASVWITDCRSESRLLCGDVMCRRDVQGQPQP